MSLLSSACLPSWWDWSGTDWRLVACGHGACRQAPVCSPGEGAPQGLDKYSLGRREDAVFASCLNHLQAYSDGPSEGASPQAVWSVPHGPAQSWGAAPMLTVRRALGVQPHPPEKSQTSRCPTAGCPWWDEGPAWQGGARAYPGSLRELRKSDSWIGGLSGCLRLHQGGRGWGEILPKGVASL